MVTGSTITLKAWLSSVDFGHPSVSTAMLTVDDPTSMVELYLDGSGGLVAVPVPSPATQPRSAFKRLAMGFLASLS